ncbi:MAG: hypothetical protein COV34_00285 [Candidatus Zambryskibacteria bacterium CG10_big_fil_rev_8_21_14_0_10_42_12]|uniref:Metallo-beta-lactamase domain-containing protein n=1 Tax=Candidatus Zambryskibacteria bacterium CG10_big_fil_rev_8_21_14_0_10_42_12 TaxID=1975115 RepID=A0A2H0QXV3_9BACT|nr:MAG: hypothetical protein COV34_00285 [Candidatus Zambryskibacteria bacterium CG10_big_fil_rev_8_21_14_0_10_42_12]
MTKRLFILIMIVLGNMGVWSYVVAEKPREGVKVAFLDVGQGDAIFIEAPNGKQMLIDGGRDQTVLRELRKVMPFWDRSIDIVLATHPDADHIGGLIDVLERYEIDVFIDSGNIGETETYEYIEELADLEGAEEIEGKAGQIVWLSDDVYFAILFPDRDVSGVESNTASVVGQLVYGETQVLLTGDSPQEIEWHLVATYGEKLESEILKAGHHGSRTSTGALFLNEVAPEEVVISAGKDNRYGHPHKEVVDFVESFGAEIVNTGEIGRIEYVLYPDGTFEKK